MTTSNYDFLSGTAEMAARMRAVDWSKTPLGPVEGWPESLRSALSICVGSRFPIAIYWGERLTLLYNDAWSPIPGTKHPWALGRDAREVWPEIWNTIGPLFEHVHTTGEATYSEDSLLPMHRHGYTEECYFNFTFTPIRGAGGRVEGVFNAVIETTYRVISERRTRVLRELSETTAGAKSREEACALAARSLAAAPADVTFCAIYLADDASRTARLAAVEGVAADAALLPPAIALADDDARSPWRFAHAVASGKVEVVTGIDAYFGGRLPGGPWPEPTTTALVAAMAAGTASGVAGVLVIGASPRRAVDDEYRQFAQRAAENVGRVVSTVAALEAERRRAEALAELDRAKTVFFSNVSHEFRTPLTLMLAPLEDALGDADRLAAEDRERLALAHRNALRLLKLVNTLLDFSRIEAGRIDASYEPTDLCAYTAELASVFRSAVERAGVRYVVDCGGMAERVYVDRDMWEKIVLNLISNAFKFTFDGEIEVAMRREGDRAVLTVRDTGVGIPADELQHVFERFHRVKGVHGRTVEGSGIGLALVRELVRLHGGTVGVESEVGRGSRFTVSIPLGKDHLPEERIGSARTLAATSVRAEAYVNEAMGWLPAETPEPVPKAPVAAAVPSARIVLADDNADMREYIRRLLAERYEVVAVQDGLAALAAARAQRPDIVLTDVMMPRLDGFGLLARLRADEALHTMPVILLSARAGEEARVEGMAAGADDYLVKPFGAKELLARVAAHLQLARVRQAVAEREQALRADAQAAKERLELMLAGVTDQFFVLDRDGRYVFLNDRVCAVTGKSREALLGQRIWSVFPELAGSDFERRLRQAMDRDAPAHFEFFYRPLKRWFENRIYPYASGVSVFVADITERRRAEEEVRESEERFRAIVETSPECVKLVAADGTLLQMNSAGLAMVGADAAETVAGRSVYDLIAPEHRDAFRAFNERVCRGEKGALEFDIVGLTGVRRHMETRAAPLKRPDGSTVQLAVTRDVTERRRAQAALEESDRRKDEFLATLAHELRNPLAPLRNALHILRMAGGGDAELRIHDTMERQVNHLVRLVDDLLEMSRISRGTFELRKEHVGLEAIVNTAVETSAPLMQSAGHRLAVKLPDERLWLEGDPVRLVQILSNLLNNAAKYTDPGGDIRVEARREGGAVVISVRDNGAGISPAMLGRIFEMFSRGDQASKRGHGGLGIGLALARKLASMHAGTIEAFSDGPGKGSEFRVRLPLVTGPDTLDGSPQSRRAALPARRRIMVVDDNRDAADTLGMVLEFLGADVRVVLEGAKAVDEIGSYDPSVVLLDIGMPGMDGYEVARRIRQRFPGRRPAIIALTGWGQDEDRRRAREAGFDHHLVKPVEITALQALLASLDAPGLRTA